MTTYDYQSSGRGHQTNSWTGGICILSGIYVPPNLSSDFCLLDVPAQDIASCLSSIDSSIPHAWLELGAARQMLESMLDGIGGVYWDDRNVEELTLFWHMACFINYP